MLTDDDALLFPAVRLPEDHVMDDLAMARGEAGVYGAPRHVTAQSGSSPSPCMAGYDDEDHPVDTARARRPGSGWG